MSTQTKKIVAYLMLALLFISQAVYSLDAKWFVHELDHENHVMASSFQHDHPLVYVKNGKVQQEILSPTENHLLDAAAQFHLPLLLARYICDLAKSDPQGRLLPCAIEAPSQLAPEPLYRPPRLIA